MTQSNTRLRRDAGVPLHRQLYLVISDGIQAGLYKPGEAIPTEKEMIDSYGVSRVTVRSAIKALKDDGFVEVGSGRRTTVRETVGSPLKSSGVSMLEYLKDFGSDTTPHVLEFGNCPVPDYLSDKLWLGTAREVQRVVRVRTRDEVPLVMITSFVSTEIGRHYDRDDLNNGPMYEALAKAGAPLSEGEQDVTAILANPSMASNLDVQIGSPLIQVRKLMRDAVGRAVQYTEDLVVPTRMHLRFEMKDATFGLSAGLRDAD